LSRPGHELLEGSYQRIAAAVADLAVSDTALQHHLASIHKHIKLSLRATTLADDMHTCTVTSDGKSLSVPDVPFGREKGEITKMTVPARAFLQQQTADEALTCIAKELAHVIANHRAEQKSCGLLSNVAIPAMAVMLTLGGVSIIYSFAVASAINLMSLIWRPIWLHRHQVYEADAIAAAICTTAGSSPDSVLTSMQRAYCAAASTPERTLLHHVCKQRVQGHLVKLQSLLPQSQIPQEPFNDSVRMQVVVDAAAQEVSSASDEVKAAYRQEVQGLEECLAVELCSLRNPWKEWKTMQPHWLDRIAHIEQLLGSTAFSEFDAKAIKGSKQDAHIAFSFLDRYTVYTPYDAETYLCCAAFMTASLWVHLPVRIAGANDTIILFVSVPSVRHSLGACCLSGKCTKPCCINIVSLVCWLLGCHQHTMVAQAEVSCSMM